MCGVCVCGEFCCSLAIVCVCWLGGVDIVFRLMVGLVFWCILVVAVLSSWVGLFLVYSGA